MSPTSRDTVVFWIKVSLGLSSILLLLGMLACLIFFTIAQIRTLDENRERDKAMLQQHSTELQQHQKALQDHVRAREEHARAFDAMLQRHAR